MKIHAMIYVDKTGKKKLQKSGKKSKCKLFYIY